MPVNHWARGHPPSQAPAGPLMGHNASREDLLLLPGVKPGRKGETGKGKTSGSRHQLSREKHLQETPPRVPAMPWKGWRNRSWGRGKTLPSYPFSAYPTFWVLGWPSSGCRTRRGARGQLQGEQGDRGAGSQHLQGGSTAPACARGTGLRVSTFRYSFHPSPAPARSAAAAVKERSSRVRLV